MENVNEYDYEIDYAYIKSEVKEFGVAHISLKIGNNVLLLLVEVDDAIEAADLENLLMSLQKNQFKKMRINIAEDCKVILYEAGVTKNIELANIDEKLKLVGIKPVER